MEFINLLKESAEQQPKPEIPIFKTVGLPDEGEDGDPVVCMVCGEDKDGNTWVCNRCVKEYNDEFQEAVAAWESRDEEPEKAPESPNQGALEEISNYIGELSDNLDGWREGEKAGYLTPTEPNRQTRKETRNNLLVAIRTLSALRDRLE